MSNIDFINEERAAHIGSFLVGRLLPFTQKKSVGPFVFIDHMGPATLGANESLDVGAHPHIGLSTLTYLFEGSIMHRDSLGTELEIKPGAVNWMAAGKGVVHSERSPEYQRGREKKLHGLQIWVALPKELEEMNPEFHHIEEQNIPSWLKDEVRYKLIAGEALNKVSPVPVKSPLYFIEMINNTGVSKKIDIGNELYGESGLYILEGSIEADGQAYDSKQILITTDATLCSFNINPHTKVYIFGGTPFPEPRYIHWNFVATDKDKIQHAIDKWKNNEFPLVPGETELVPYPEKK